MPTIFEYFGFVFKFYSNEHEPIHVHVQKGGAEVIFEIIIDDAEIVEIRQRNSKAQTFSENDLKIALSFVEKYAPEIVDKWIDFFVLKKKIKKTNIKDKI
ncbi:MAG: DUF4160 domain-containing protein [Bacteroidales bacterium]|nr:DUF4160 domain-containing protein [Bacteroidales bacterium]